MPLFSAVSIISITAVITQQKILFAVKLQLLAVIQ